MKATIITIGDEILIGQIVDTNSAWMAQELNKIGVHVFEIITINDDKDHILSAFAKAESQSDIVLITGGLGPTKDDVTKATICEYFDDELVLDQQVLEHVTQLFAKYVKDPMVDMNKAQALIPSKAEVIKNSYGTAPGMWLERNDVVFVSMPGVPFEMKEIMTNGVIPRILTNPDLPYIHHRTILTAGQGESTIATRIENWENQLPSHIKLAYLPSLGTVRLRLSTFGTDKSIVEKEVDDQIKELYTLITDIIVGESNNESLVDQVSRLFKEQNKTLATAESCTGGKIANLITEIPGASAFFKGSTITYATQSKIDILGVDEALITEHSVVSEQVAEAMAVAAKKKFKSDYAIATTGNAGPSKGDSDATVGTVFIGVATESESFAMKFMMGNHRERVIQKTVNKSFELLQKELLKKPAI
ncbi:nicotinamide-nucleotide amidase [Nonlabens dokdonensis]|uniref:CinA-like protein n=2 Tax=Nonlabens dokdonensis TaxID=328515 RepID=L7W6S5_NONDD|nr:CinA family nicotinamide mononucleotide deamidase-related protein [Nonlabens dokdonensis]AGC77375.1 competence/damage-inducible protein [Nonlabens dokdonensis DSW-6]PZX40901.1 nicotinamide-nucleotide amidase [Nonlabens dokdonensis]